MLLHNILILFFLLFILHPSLCLCYLIFSTLSFSCSFLFSKFSLFLFKFLTQILFFFFPIFFSLSFEFFLYYERVSSFAVWAIGVGVVGHRCGCGESSTSWSCCGYGGSSVLGHAMGVGLCHGVCGSCHGVSVVGH